jgi:hypothetical protein
MPKDDIQEVCNAPSKNGVFCYPPLLYFRVEMVYLGVQIAVWNLSGLKNQIMMRAKFLQAKIKEEGAEAVDIYWYVTNEDNPKEVELIILSLYVDVNEAVPRWNYNM